MSKRFLRPAGLLIGVITALLVGRIWLQAGEAGPPGVGVESMELLAVHGWSEWASAAEAQANNTRLALVLLLAGVGLMAGTVGWSKWAGKPRFVLRSYLLSGKPRFALQLYLLPGKPRFALQPYLLFGKPRFALQSYPLPGKPRFGLQSYLLIIGGLVWVVGLVVMGLGVSRPAGALPAYITDAPNVQNAMFDVPAVGTCAACHGFNNAKHPVGQFPQTLAFALAGGTLNAAWHGKPDKALIDSDGDGFTNGEELQDPGGVWPYDGANNVYLTYPGYLSNPSEISSVPPPPQITSISGINNGQLLNTPAVEVNLQYAGLSKVVYSFKTLNGVEVYSHTVQSTSPTNYANNFCLANGSSSTASTGTCPAWHSSVLPNGVYNLVVTAYDRRAAAQGGPQTGSLTRTNLIVDNSRNPTVLTDDLSNNNNCTLREAIIAANTNSQVDRCLPGHPGPDTLQLQAGTYQLSRIGVNEDQASTGDLDIVESLTIQGVSALSTTIDGGDIDRIFHILSGVTVNISGVTMTNGQAIAGAGLFIDSNSPVTLIDSTLTGNNATSNSGGGIYNVGVLAVKNSTINGNSTFLNGGGLFSSGSATLINSTVSGNSARNNGGGIYGQVDLYNATIASNKANSDGAGEGSGGGIYSDGTVTLRNTILANNVRDAGIINLFQDCVGPLDSGGYNLIRSGCTIAGDQTGNQIGVDPELGSLSNHGGQTKTQGLNPGSPAIDAGNPDGCQDETGSDLITDQRGYVRPAAGDGNGSLRCDIGAFEFGASANTPPALSSITDQTTPINTPTTPLPFTIGDAHTPLDSLILSGSSSNQTLVSDGSIVFEGSGANRTVTITPVTGQSGSAAITISVSDGVLTTESSFDLTVVDPSNNAPTLSGIPNQTTAINTPAAPIPFTIGDAQTPAGDLSVSGSSSNQTLVPNGNLVFGGSGANRTVTITPAAGQSGQTIITINVSDGTATTSTSFELAVVDPSNNAPTLSNIPNQTTALNTPTAPIPFTIGDAQTPAGNLILSGSSSNQTLIPNANIVFGGSGANRTMTITPAAGQSGQVTITLSVSDGAITTSDSFVLTVKPGGEPAANRIYLPVVVR